MPHCRAHFALSVSTLAAPSSLCVIVTAEDFSLTGTIGGSNAVTLSGTLPTVGSVGTTISITAQLSPSASMRNGTYDIVAGRGLACTNSTSGNITGTTVPSISGSWSGTATWMGGPTDNVSGKITESQT